MTFENFTSLVGFAFVMSISPGPGNFLLLASGANFGVARTLPLIFGICFGFLSMVLAIGLGFGQVFRAYPSIYMGLQILCITYVCWMAWKIAHIRSLGNAMAAHTSKPIGFVQAAVLQLVNPKAWAVALVVTVSFTDQGNYLASLATMITVFALVNLPSISIWALFGRTLQTWLDTQRRARLFNIAMALLLVSTMIPVLLGTFGS